MSATPLGKLPEFLAQQFVCENPLATLGSRSADGSRRIVTTATGDDLHQLRLIIQEYGGTVSSSETYRESPGLGDRIKQALSSVGITEERVSGWLGAPCNCDERVQKLNRLGDWASSILSGKQAPAPFEQPAVVVPASRYVCGCVHDGEVKEFEAWAKPQTKSLYFGLKPTPSSHRRVLCDPGHEDVLTRLVNQWNKGHDRPQTDVPYVKGRWQYAVTTVQSRFETTLQPTMNSLFDAGFTDPELFVDGPWVNYGDVCNYDRVHFRGANIRTFSHWHLTLLELYNRDPWAEYYAIFQDDFVAVKNLKAYFERCNKPDKAYFNLFTFMENEQVVKDRKGWVEAAYAIAPDNTRSHQLGRGAVGLIFPHDACIALLSCPHMITRRMDSQRGHHSLDGAVVESMNQSGYTEYVHAPSLLQHTGEKSSMGNRRHPQALTFPGEDFDALTLL